MSREIKGWVFAKVHLFNTILIWQINLKSIKCFVYFKGTKLKGDVSFNVIFNDLQYWNNYFIAFSYDKEGVVIVDTPGIEGGSNVDEHLQRYLTKAFGFIYVINTNTAGGVQQNRVRVTVTI